MRTLYQNAKLVLPSGIQTGCLLCEGETILEVSPQAQLPNDAAEHVVDVQGEYLAPGFIDVHVHGGGGADFMDCTDEAVDQILRLHRAHGTTALMPTLLSSAQETMMNAIHFYQQRDDVKEGMPTLLGMHIEGPYFDADMRGAQDVRYLRDPLPQEYLPVLANPQKIVRWSFAPELQGGDAFLQALQRNGIITSAAHTNATCAQIAHAYDLGLAALTHFYSGMSSIRRIQAYRVAGVVEAGYLLDGLSLEVIADGCHLPRELLQLITKVKSPDKVILVTDAMRAAGMPPGEHRLGDQQTGQVVIVEDGVAKLPDRSSFAGSVATMDRLVRTMRTHTDVPLHQIVHMASLNPARLIRQENRKGSLAPGKDADLVIFDEDINIKQVVIRGQSVQDASFSIG